MSKFGLPSVSKFPKDSASNEEKGQTPLSSFLAKLNLSDAVTACQSNKIEAPEDFDGHSEADLVAAGLNVDAAQKIKQARASSQPETKTPTLTKAHIEEAKAALKNMEAAFESGKKSLASSLDPLGLSSKLSSLVPNVGPLKGPLNSLDAVRAKIQTLDFYLRMGFEDMKPDEGRTPIEGIMDLPLPPTLQVASSEICGEADVTKCVGKGMELAGKQVGQPKKNCSGELYAAILLYTSDAIYAALNKALRDENREAVKKYFKYLRLLLETFDTLPQQECQLWRGIGVDLYDSYKVGSTITWWSVSSCTSDENVARTFANNCGKECTMITVLAKTACDISQITFYDHEKESLLAPGTQFKVLKSEKKGKVTEILLEEVGRLLK